MTVLWILRHLPRLKQNPSPGTIGYDICFVAADLEQILQYYSASSSSVPDSRARL